MKYSKQQIYCTFLIKPYAKSLLDYHILWYLLFVQITSIPQIFGHYSIGKAYSFLKEEMHPCILAFSERERARVNGRESRGLLG